jgi:hypothetical protein
MVNRHGSIKTESQLTVVLISKSAPRGDRTPDLILKRDLLYQLSYGRIKNKNKVPEVGIEPTSLTRHDFKSCAYTSSATRAIIMFKFSNYNLRPGAELNRRIFLLQRNALPLGYQAILLLK